LRGVFYDAISFKKGCNSFAFNQNGISNHYTLTSRGNAIKELMHEQKITSRINSAFVQKYIYGEKRNRKDLQTGQVIKKMSFCSQSRK